MKKILFTLLASFAVLSFAMAQKQWFNDKDLILTGSYYYPEHWNQSEWERDLSQMHEMGFEFTHFAEFAWAQLEPQEGKYDFAWLDKAVGLAAKYKLKVIMCTSTETPPVWLVRKYPEVLVKHENGQSSDHGARGHASFSSPLYRELAFRMIEKLAQHYGNDARIIGWQIDNEPPVQHDYNDKAFIAFRDFLKTKYHNNINELNDAWGTSFWSQNYSSFDEINIPRNGGNPHQALDYQRFAVKQTNDFLNEQTLLIQKYSKNQWVTTNYIPGYESGHIGGSPAMDFVTYTRYMVHGDDDGIGQNGFRVGNPLGISMPNDFFRPIRGTYGVMELQPGQVNWGNINPQPLPGAIRMWLWNVFAGGSDIVCTYRYRQPLYGSEQYHYGIVGPDGVTPTLGGLEYQQFMKEIRQLRNIAAKREVKPSEYLARRTAILFNPENAWNISMQKQNENWNTYAHSTKYYCTLKSFGAPVDIISEEKDFSQYPVLIVPAFQMADAALVARWKKYAENGGNLVITCRTAHKDRCGRLPEAPFRSMIDELVGNKLDFFDLLLKKYPGKVSMDGKNYTWYTWGEILKPEKGTEVWATYADGYYNGRPAVTSHRFGKGSVTYVGVDTSDGEMEAAVLKKLYARLGIGVMDLPYGVMLEYRNGFGIVMNYSDKSYDFILPAGAKAVIGSTNIPSAGVLVFTAVK